jgi:hypothetical protein
MKTQIEVPEIRNTVTKRKNSIESITMRLDQRKGSVSSKKLPNQRSKKKKN